MAKKKSSGGGQAIEGASRATMFRMDPDEIKLIIDPMHPLFDRRALKKPSESMIRSVGPKGPGLIHPLIVRKDGDDVELVAGRTRLLALREAKKRATEAGQLAPTALCILRKGDDRAMFQTMVTENTHRTNEDALALAEKAARFQNMGANEKEICETFDWSIGTLKNHLALLDLDTKIQNEIRAGAVSPIAASKLAALPREEQVTEYERLKTEGTLTIADVSTSVTNVKREKKNGGNGTTHEHKHVPPNRSLLKKLLKGCVKEEASLSDQKKIEEDRILMLRWMCGEISARGVPGLAPALTKLGLTASDE